MDLQGNSDVVLVTSDSVVYKYTANRAGIVCAPLLEEAGVMSAISSRVSRMSSFIFGGTPEPMRRLVSCHHHITVLFTN